VLVQECGGRDPDNWYVWCRSECVPEHARTVPCDANEVCVLCDAPRDDGNTTYFGLPGDELEYLWTLTDDPREPFHPEVEPAATGVAFIDEPTSFAGEDGEVGAWSAYAPFEEPVFCEPGPNFYTPDNVLATDGAMVLRAVRSEDEDPTLCPGGRCRVGPYTACESEEPVCQYRELPDESGLGSGSQADRLVDDEMATYGYGHFRAVFRASGDGRPPQDGFVYAFFTQGNLACVDGLANVETNTSELDIEVSSGLGEAGGERFCVAGESCLQISTWVSSEQGLEGGGTLRHQVSGFRFRDPHFASTYRTYGWDWQPDDVRFTYDADPHDCDEAAGACTPTTRSLAICRHLRFIPRRPAPLHFQLWNAWWAGTPEGGTEALMSVERVWHEPSASE